MKLYFINPPYKAEYGRFSRESRSPAITKSGALYYPLWLIYSASYAKKRGCNIIFLDAPAKCFNDEQTINKISNDIHDNEKIIFIINTSTPSLKSDVIFGAKLKNSYSKSFILLVGTHPSALPEETLMINKSINAVARGEYDLIVNELAKALEGNLDLGKVRGLTWRNMETNKICSNENMSYFEDMDELPYASEFIKEHLKTADYFFPAATWPSIQIFTGRGCPFRCNFCLYPQVMHGHKYRMRSVENIVGEFQYIVENFQEVKEVIIEDDTFTIDKKRVVTICKLLIERKIHKKLRWLCNARVDLDFETMKMMKNAGCRLIIPGIESGNQQILNNIKKGTKVDQIEEYVKSAKRAGLLVHACYMVGNQGETKETMKDTLNLALKLNTDTAQFFPLIPYPGTEAYAWAKQNGYLEEDYEKYCKIDGTHNTVLNLPELSASEMVDFCDMARKKYYLRPRYILHRLKLGITNINDLKRSLKAFKNIRGYLFK